MHLAQEDFSNASFSHTKRQQRKDMAEPYKRMHSERQGEGGRAKFLFHFTLEPGVPPMQQVKVIPSSHFTNGDYGTNCHKMW